MSQIRIYKASKDGYIKVSEGVERKTLTYGDNTLMTEFRLHKGQVLPLHKHPQEQTGYLVSGNIILTIDGKSYNMNPGDSWSIPGDVVHFADIIVDSIAIEVFSPIRKDYLP